MAPSSTSPSILIVENDANTLHIMRDYLTRADFKIRTAPNGWDALKRLKDGPVDLVISELNLADDNGAGLREKLVLNPGTRDVPFLYVIPENKTEILVRALRSGVDDCITKPFDPIVLVARVQAVIERRRAYEQMVRVDPLTRLLNRPALEKEVREELSRIERYKRTGSMVLVDIDDFASVNAQNGVAMGDLLLTCLAGVILSNIRGMDRAGRFDGEKFLLFLPETDEKGAEAFTQRMQTKMAAIADAIAGIGLTFSSGIVVAPRDGSEFEVLRERLYSAVRFAKARQKGSIVVWSRDIAESASTDGHAVKEI